MLLGRVTRRDEPNGSRSKADKGADPKGKAPAVMHHEIGNKWWRKTRAHADAGKNQTVGDAALLSRNPARHDLIRCGINHRFSAAEQKADRCENQNRACNTDGNGRGERREHAPPQNSGGEHAPRAELVRQPTRDGLEESIAEQKCAEDGAELYVAEVILSGDGAARDGNIDAIEKRHRAQHEEPSHKQPPDSACWLLRHARLMASSRAVVSGFICRSSLGVRASAPTLRMQ